MGAQCSRLCFRPCRKQLTIRERLKNVYSQAPVQITENYCRNKTLKICEYLKDRKSHITHCIQEFKSIISAISTESSIESERKITITLYCLRTLCENLKDFLPITYHFLYQLMQNPYFSQVKINVYETLTLTTMMYPDEDINALEDIMTELIKYLSEPKNVSKHEIKLLTSIIVPLHERIVGSNYFDWRKLMDLILERIVLSTEFEEELGLLGIFSQLLLNIKAISEIFLDHLIRYLDKNSAWNNHALNIFDSVIQSSPEYFKQNSSVVFKVFVDYIQHQEQGDVAPIVECLNLVIENAESISTLHYSSVFEEVITKIFSNSCDSGCKVLKLWVFKAENQSFFKFLHDVLFTKEPKQAQQLIVKTFKVKIDHEFKKTKCPMAFLQPILELIYDTITHLKYVYSDFLLKILFKRSELVSACGLVIKILKSDTCNINTYKYSLNLLISITNQENQEFLAMATSLIIKLRGIMTKENSMCLGVLLWTFIKAIGTKYNSPNILEFVINTVTKHLKVEPTRSYLLDSDNFEKILKGEVSIFRKNFVSKETLRESIFDIESIMERKSDYKDLEEDEKDDDYLGMYNSDTEFSSVSSFDLQDRIIDLQDIKPEIINTDYQKLLLNQEEQDRKFLEQLSILSVES